MRSIRDLGGIVEEKSPDQTLALLSLSRYSPVETKMGRKMRQVTGIGLVFGRWICLFNFKGSQSRILQKCFATT
jgi:hypothetical protein